MMRGFRIVYRDECGDESHLGEYHTRLEADTAMVEMRELYSCEEGQRLWVEGFDHNAPYFDESSGRMVYPDEDY